MAEPLTQALARLRSPLLAEDDLVRAVVSGRRRGTAPPPWRRVELRYVDLKRGRHLQLTAYDQTQAHTSNHEVGEAARVAVDDLLDQPFGTWHVETREETHQLRVTKKGEALLHSRSRQDATVPDHSHDRAKQRLLPEDDPVLVELGISDAQGRVKPSRQGKYRQVEELVRALEAALDEAFAAGALRRPTAGDPLRLVDLGCGNAYLTFAAHRYLTAVRELPVELVGVDVKAQSRDHSTALAERLGVGGSLRFVRGDIASAEVHPAPEVVLSLHACDTATDDALARAVAWRAPLLLAAPCCHHDVAAQLRGTPTPAPYSLLTRSGILRERFADTLTDALRAAVLRQAGYRVDVMEFVESRHTPRNTLLRGVRTGALASAEAGQELAELTEAWGVRPRLAELLAPPQR